MHCDYIFVLIRTDTSAPRHEGISLILVDMDQLGVEVSPIRLISGESSFCETVFNDAMAPANDVVGGVNKGWTVGKRLLQYERSTHAGINTSGSQGGRNMESPLPELVKRYHSDQYERIGDPALRRRVIDHQLAFKGSNLPNNESSKKPRPALPVSPHLP